MNTWFRSLLMQGAGEEPASGWEYADYIHPKTTSSNGIVLNSYRISNTGTFEVDFKIPTSTTSNDNLFLINNGFLAIKVYYSSNKLVVNIANAAISYNTPYTSTITDDGTLVHKLTIKGGYIWLDKVKCTSTQIVTSTQAANPKIAYNFTSDCRIYNIYYYNTAETHAHMVFSKSKGFETPESCLNSSQFPTNVVISSADEWVGNFDYEPAYVNYIEPVNEPYKLLNLHISAYPHHKIACEVSTTSGVIFFSGFWVDYDDYYESGYYNLTGGSNSSVLFKESPSQYTFTSVNKGTKFTFDNFSGTPKMNGATGISSNIGYDRSWTEDDEGVIKRVDCIYSGTKFYSFKIQVNGGGTIYDCLPAKPHYNVAWDNIDGYLIDKNTGFVFTTVCDTSTVDKQRVYYNPVDDPDITVGSALQYYDNFMDPNYPAPTAIQYNQGDVVEIKISNMSDLASYKNPNISLFTQMFGYVNSSTQLRTNYTEKMYGDTSYRYYYLSNGVNRSGGMV